MVVDLHWAVTAAVEYPVHSLALPLEQAGFWSRLETVSLAGTPVPSFAPEDLLLVLCVHGSKHRWERLEWIACVAECLRARPRLDWGLLSRQARVLGSRRMLHLGLLLAHEILDAPLPPDVLARIRADRAAHALARQVRDALFAPRHAPPGIVGRSVFYLRMRERLRDRLRYGLLLARLSVTPTRAQRMRLSLPARLAFVHYALRPLYLVAKYGRFTRIA
jgi:hypothetical protein